MLDFSKGFKSLTFCLCALIFIGLPLQAQGLPGQSKSKKLIEYSSQFQPVMAENGMIASQEEHATRAGLSILKKGGNAVDAAVATGFALAVTHPQAGNIGGGGFMLVYLAAEDQTIAIDYREMAPKAADRDMFLDEAGNVDQKKAFFSHHSSGIPGTVMGLLEALEKYGTMSRADVMAPAIELAEQGFIMPYVLHDTLKRYTKRMIADQTTKTYFFPIEGQNGPEPLPVGSLFTQADLANTLKAISASGAKGFYEGPVAKQIIDAIQAGGGIMTLADLKAYKTVTRKPISGTFNGYKIVSMPPPSSGGVHIIQMLNVLEGYDLYNMGHNSAAYLHRLTETMKYAYADRSKYLGDSDFVDVPLAALTDKDYAATIRARIKDRQATPSDDIAPAPQLPYESHDTTHFSVIDRAGNMVANTTTLNFTFGSSKAVMGGGFLLNNEMDDFSAKPGTPNGFGLLGGEANAIAPFKRPLSSMTPTLVFKDNKPFMATGSPGGSSIITAVLQTILNTTVFNMNAQGATNVPRIHHQWYPDRVTIEPGISIDTLRLMEQMGHNLKTNSKDPWDRLLGSTQTIMRLPDGQLHGASDPRRPGALAAGY